MCNQLRLSAKGGNSESRSKPEWHRHEASELRKRIEATAAEAERLWKTAKPATADHPYLKGKGIDEPGELRVVVDPDTHDDILLVPVRNERGELQSLQQFFPGADKPLFLKGAGTTKNCYVTVISAKFDEAGKLYLCEGWATGWSIHRATEVPAIVCFSDSGIVNVAPIMRRKYPSAQIVIAADNDRWTKREGKPYNPGVEAARKAAKAIGAKVAVPDFANLKKRPTDYDDLRQLEGLDAVRRWLNPAMAERARTEPKARAKPKVSEPDSDSEPEGYVRRRELANLQQRFMADPGSLAHRLLDRMAAQILIVELEDGDTWALTALRSGLWSTSPEPWRRALRQELKSMIVDIADGLIAGKMTASVATRRTNRIHQALRHIDRTVTAVRASIATAWHVEMRPYRHNADFDRPRLVRHADLDADLDVLGFDNGVCDLRSGKLLDPVAGADRFVTVSTGIDYRTDADHEAVDRMFAHLDPDLRTFWIGALAWALRGRPSRRIYLTVGQKNSGKTTVATAVQLALGNQYSEILKSDALCVQRGDAAHSGIAVFAGPRRIITVEEPKTARLDTALLKDLSGGGNVKIRELHKNPRTIAATGSLFIFSNPGASVPRLGLADEALADRFRELPYPPVPETEVDPTFIHDTIHRKDFREALLVRLIAVGAKMTRPPAAPAAVQEASQRRLELDLSPLEQLCRRIVRAASAFDFLTARAVWTAWCDVLGEEVPNETNTKIGKFSKKTLAMAVGRHVSDLPKTSKETIGGVRETGWRGWQLK